MYSQYLGFSTQMYGGRGLVQTFPLFYFVKNIIQTKPNASSFQLQQKTAFSTRHSEPWSVLDHCSSASISTRASSRCKSLPFSAHCRAWCSSRGTSLCKRPVDLHHAPHLWRHITRQYSGACGLWRAHWLNDPWLSFLCIFQMFVKEMY